MDNEWHGYSSSMELAERDNARERKRIWRLVRGRMEETLTTGVTSGKAGVWRKKKGRKKGRSERKGGMSLLRVILFLLDLSMDKILCEVSNCSIVHQGSLRSSNEYSSIPVLPC